MKLHSKKYLTFCTLLIINYLIYVNNNFNLIISLDLEANLVKGKDSLNFLPYTNLWDHKGPIHFYVFGILYLITLNKISIINFMIIFVNTIICYLIFRKNLIFSKSISLSILPAIFYLYLANDKIFGNSIYYEQIIFLILIYLIYLLNNKKNLNIVPIVFALTTLFVNVVYIYVPIFLFLYFKMKKFYRFIFLSTLPYFFIALVYFITGNFKIFYYTNFIYPLTYVSERADVGFLSIFYLLKNDVGVWYLIYFLTLILIFIFISINSRIKNIFTLQNLTICYLMISSLFIPIISGKYYGHHFLFFLLFFLYYFSFLYTYQKNKIFIKFLTKFIGIIVFLSLTFNLFPTFKKNLDQVNIFKIYEYEIIANEISKKYPDAKTIFANRNIIFSNLTNLKTVNFIAFSPVYFEQLDLVSQLQKYSNKNDTAKSIISSEPDVLICGYNFEDFYNSICKNGNYFVFRDFNGSTIFIHNKFK